MPDGVGDKRMTREEADFIGGMNMCDEISNETYKKIMCHCEEQEPKTGRWIWWTDDRKDYAKCSECCFGEEGEMFWSDVTNYCPNCGARME